MSPLVVLEKIKQAGGSVVVEDNDLLVRVPSGTLTPRDQEVLARHKEELLGLLWTEEAQERAAIQWESICSAAEGDRFLQRASELFSAHVVSVGQKADETWEQAGGGGVES